jgi:hypothetical protein
VAQTLGQKTAAAWLRARGGSSPPTHERWYVEIAMGLARERPPTDFDEATATRLHVSIYAEEWGVYFCHRGRSSWIRVTDLPFVHGRDDHGLLTILPASLADFGSFVRRLEASEHVRFERAHAAIKTNLASLEPAVRSWLAAL